MKVGDLVREVKRKYLTTPRVGIVLGFDSAGDPIIRDNNGLLEAWWAHKTVVVAKRK